MDVSKKVTGFEVERMPNIAFRLMAFIFVIRDALFSVGKKLDQFGFVKGSIVLDFGCGPGSYIAHASQLVGDKGKVYAVDVQPLAIKAVSKKVARHNLENVFPLLSTGYPIDINSHTIDFIYALDMFHHIKDSQPFLKELHRLLKPEGTLFIESGHQHLDAARQKILDSGYWKVITEDRNRFTCVPKKPEDN